MKPLEGRTNDTTTTAALVLLSSQRYLKSHRTESLEVRDLKAQYFDTLSKMEHRSTTENNRAKIWIDQMEGLLKI